MTLILTKEIAQCKICSQNFIRTQFKKQICTPCVIKLHDQKIKYKRKIGKQLRQQKRLARICFICGNTNKKIEYSWYKIDEKLDRYMCQICYYRKRNNKNIPG